jgi:hypothetical protein
MRCVQDVERVWGVVTHLFKLGAWVSLDLPAGSARHQLLGRLAPLPAVEFVLVVGGTIVTVTPPCSKLSQPSRSAVRTKYWPETVAAYVSEGPLCTTTG